MAADQEIGAGLSWALNQEPTMENVRDMKKIYPEEFADYETFDYKKPVAAFTIRMPHAILQRNSVIEREFPGGNMASLLWFIYHFYQESLSVKELEDLWSNEKDIVYRDVYAQFLQRANWGENVKRMELDFNKGNTIAFDCV
jgi:hypothetical protein